MSFFRLVVGVFARTRQNSVLVATLISVVLTAPVSVLAQGSEWNFAGGDRQNTRAQPSENKISINNVNRLNVQWVFTTAGDVSATPAIDASTVYIPDWAGYIYAVDRATGTLKWSRQVSDITGVPGDKARATPAVTDEKIVVGTQGPFGGGGKVIALDKLTGAVAWSTQADSHPAAIITQSATVFDGRVYVGVASQEELFAALVPNYELSFRGSFVALDLATGRILWKTFMAPERYTGNAVWGSSPSIDPKRGQVYIGTGNNYSVPQSVLDCVAAAGSDQVAIMACIAPDNYFDSIVALDLRTGAIRWATRAIAYDAWTMACILGGSNCPDPAGSNFDFAQAPALFKTRAPDSKQTERLGVGQKSGQYWSLDPDTGAVVWVTRTGPGGTRGGLQWGSAVDGKRVYVSNANSDQTPWMPLNSLQATTKGAWSGLDAVTGQIVWQTVDPNDGGGPSGPVTTANGVVFGCSLDPSGHMYAMNAATGAILWSFASGGSCVSGAAIANGTVYWGSGYSNLGQGTPNNKLFAFRLAN